MPDIQKVFNHTPFINEQHKAFASILYLGMVCEKHVQKTLDEFDIPVNKYRILRGLRKVYPEGVGIYKLRDFLIEPNADISRLVERMLKRGLVISKTDPVNKSAKQIVITQQGIDLVDQIDKHQHEFVKPMMCLSDEEAKQLNDMAERLVDSFTKFKRSN